MAWECLSVLFPPPQDIVIQQDDEIRLKIVGTRVDKNDIVSLLTASLPVPGRAVAFFLLKSSWGFCALLPGRRDGWAEGLGLRVRGELSACFGFISIFPFLLQFAIGSLMDDYLGECQGCCLKEGCVGTGSEYGI